MCFTHSVIPYFTHGYTLLFWQAFNFYSTHKNIVFLCQIFLLCYITDCFSIFLSVYLFVCLSILLMCLVYLSEVCLSISLFPYLSIASLQSSNVQFVLVRCYFFVRSCLIICLSTCLILCILNCQFLCQVEF